ncbi:MAG: DUF2490 domain-containing protein [Bacteroidaceae bacterium]|nr:DUF2490 domain-containing protein [Bacteroidaceae bacterium]
MKKILFSTLLLLSMALCNSAYAQATEAETPDTDTEAFDTHIGTMWDLSVGKKLGPVRLMLQQSVFTIDTYMERAMTIFGGDVDIIPTYLKATALGFYLYHRSDAGQYRNLLRYHAGLNGAVPTEYITLSWAARYESTYIVGNSTPVDKFRTRLRMAVNIPNSKFSPFFGAEHFLQVNGEDSGETERVWIDLGLTYKIDKHNSVELLARAENRQLCTPQQWNANFGFAYKISL